MAGTVLEMGWETQEDGMRCSSSPPPWETARKRDEFDLFPIVNFGEKSKN